MLLAVGNPTVDYMSLDIEGAEEGVCIPSLNPVYFLYFHKNAILGPTYHSLG